MPDMLVKLYELPEYESLLPGLNAAGIQLRRALPPEKHVVSAWVNAVFGPHWASECETAMSRQPVSCLIAVEQTAEESTGKLIGFACYEATAKGYFGPTGVDPNARGKGIGKALLLAALHGMRNEGYAYGIIGGAGPVDFYAKLVGAIEIPGSVPGIYKGMLK